MASSCTPSVDIYVPNMATLSRVEPMTQLETFFEFSLDSGAPLGHMPGQFVEVSIPGLGEAPISISSTPDKNTVELVVRKVGRLTSLLHGMSPGDKIGIRGPFGSTFPVEDEMKGKNVLFICGGIGLVPVRSAIQYVLDHRDQYGDVTILYGSKSPSERLFVDEIADWAARSDVTFMETVDRADSDWTGNVGVITTLIPKVKMNPADTKVLVCGPPIMYKFVIVELYAAEVPAENIYISLERRMKCGVGKCGHCQINGYYTCIDGPVFKYSDVAEVQEAI